MTVRIRAGLAALALVVCFAPWALAQGKVEYKVLSTSKTSTMEKEMQLAAALGFRYSGVTGGSTAAGGAEVVVIMTKVAEPVEFEYRLLATSKTSTMQRELQDAGDVGFEFKGQTVFKSAFGGQEVVAILERAKDERARPRRWEYRLLATSKTSTMQKELSEAGGQGFEFVGLTVGKTVMGGDEIVTILRRDKAR
jgi:hypothetical protein